jgi:hypothetical protein
MTKEEKQNRNSEILIARISDESIYTNQLRSVVRNINNKINDSNKDLIVKNKSMECN